jgi:hypothetical protein
LRGANGSDWATFSVGLTNSAPVITAPDVSLGKGVTVDADTLFTATDPDGDADCLVPVP